LGGGWLSGWFIRRGWPVIQARLAVLLGCACAGLLAFALGIVSSTVFIVALLSVLMGCTMAWMVNLGTLLIDAIPAHALGRAWGLMTVGTIAGQFALTTGIGYSFDHELYQPLFILMSFTGLAGYAVVRLLLPKTGGRQQVVEALPAK
jgi:ACS family hexuronate transporter-like MFS transporter